MMYSNPNPVFGGMAYNGMPQMQTVKQYNNLTPEEISQLQEREVFSLKMTEKEQLKSACNHRSADGNTDSLVLEPDGTYRCMICNAKFSPVEPSVSKEEIQDAVDAIEDILQTTKLMYIGMPVEAAREYYQIIPLIERIPKLFDLAADNYRKYEQGSGWNYNNRSTGTVNLFNMLTSGMPQGYQQTPSFDMYGQPVQQGYMYQSMGQPMPTSVPVGAAAPGVNPFVGQPMPQPGYQPNMTGYQYQPGMNAPQVAPQAPYQAAPQRQPVPQPTAPVAPAPAPQAAPQAPNDKVQVATTIKA